MDAATHNEMITALEWYVDQGVSDTLLDEVIDRTVLTAPVTAPPVMPAMPVMNAAQDAKVAMDAHVFLGKSEAYDEAVRLAKGANTLDELQRVIAEFNGIAIKKTAINIVFSDGNPDADIMFIGDAPVAMDDRLGSAFTGDEGALLDNILKCIELSRDSSDMNKAVYMSNVLNWRPPGNRTPSSAEIEVSLPFIERHIQLVQPKILILSGSITAKSLLGRSEGLSKLRKSWHDYTPQTKGLCAKELESIPAMVMHSMTILIKTPLQKKAAWADILMLKDKLEIQGALHNAK